MLFYFPHLTHPSLYLFPLIPSVPSYLPSSTFLLPAYPHLLITLIFPLLCSVFCLTSCLATCCNSSLAQHDQRTQMHISDNTTLYRLSVLSFVITDRSIKKANSWEKGGCGLKVYNLVRNGETETGFLWYLQHTHGTIYTIWSSTYNHCIVNLWAVYCSFVLFTPRLLIFLT